MYSGAQVALYPMSDDFVGVILGALSALDPYRPKFQIETDEEVVEGKARGREKSEKEVMGEIQAGSSPVMTPMIRPARA